MNSVIFFHPNNDYTGSTRVLLDTIRENYPDREVVVVTQDNSAKGFFTDMENIRIKKVSYPMFRGKRIRIISALVSEMHFFFIALFRGAKYRTFYINTIVPVGAAVAGRILGKDIVFHVHEKFVKRGRIIRLREYVFNHTRATRYFVSEYTKSQYPDKYTSVVKHNKLSPDFVNEVYVRPVAERERNNILMLASLNKAKGIFTFIDLAKEMPGYNFTMVISAGTDAIDRFVGAERPSNLTILPVQRNVHPLLRQADLLMNLSIPSLWVETFGLTIIEAMAYGVPAIVPKVGGPAELVTHDENGYLADVEDIKELKGWVEKAFEKENYEKLTANALIRRKSFM